MIRITPRPPDARAKTRPQSRLTPTHPANTAMSRSYQPLSLSEGGGVPDEGGEGAYRARPNPRRKPTPARRTTSTDTRPLEDAHENIIVPAPRRRRLPTRRPVHRRPRPAPRRTRPRRLHR